MRWNRLKRSKHWEVRCCCWLKNRWWLLGAQVMMAESDPEKPGGVPAVTSLKQEQQGGVRSLAAAGLDVAAAADVALVLSTEAAWERFRWL